MAATDRLPLRIVGPSPPPYGGIGSLFERLLMLLGQRRVVVQPESIGGGYNLALRRLRRAFHYTGLCRRLAGGTPVVLHLLSSSYTNLHVNAALGWWASKHGHRVIVSLLGGGFIGMSEAAGPWFRSSIRRLAGLNALVASNDTIAEHLVRWGVEQKRIWRIDNLMPNPEPDGSGWRAVPDQFRAAPTRLLATGALGPEYGIDTLLQGFAELRSSLRDAALAVLIAEHESPSFERSLTDLAHRLQLDGSVFFLRGLPEVISVMREVDLFIRPTMVDGDAMSVWEALLEGTPVLASDTGTRPRQCTLFPIGDAAALASRAGVILADPPSVHVATVRRSAENNIDRYLELYSALGVEGSG